MLNQLVISIAVSSSPPAFPPATRLADQQPSLARAPCLKVLTLKVAKVAKFQSFKSFKSSLDCPTHLPQQLHLRASSPRDLRSPPLPSPCVQTGDHQCHYTINTHSEISLFATLDILRDNVNLGGGLTNDVTASQRGWKDTICWQNQSHGKRTCKYKHKIQNTWQPEDRGADLR